MFLGNPRIWGRLPACHCLQHIRFGAFEKSHHHRRRSDKYLEVEQLFRSRLVLTIQGCQKIILDSNLSSTGRTLPDLPLSYSEVIYIAPALLSNHALSWRHLPRRLLIRGFFLSISRITTQIFLISPVVHFVYSSSGGSLACNLSTRYRHWRMPVQDVWSEIIGVDYLIVVVSARW